MKKILDFELQREEMVATQLEARGISDVAVLEAMRKVPRHLYLPSHLREHAYEDCAVPVRDGVSLSPPYIIAYMLEQLRLGPHDKVLEIGTGTGYETALLAELCRAVYTIDIDQELMANATKRLAETGYRNVFTRCSDGHKGWPSRSPFDGIVVSAALDGVPRELMRQLGQFGRMVFPLDDDTEQFLILIEKRENEISTQELCPVRFVTMRSPKAAEETQ